MKHAHKVVILLLIALLSSTVSAFMVTELSDSDAETTYTHSIIYDANGGSGAPATQTVTNTIVVSAMTVSSTIPIRSGYIFNGWSQSSTATQVFVNAGEELTVGTTCTLYAIWVVNSSSVTHTLSYSANGGSGAPSTQTVTDANVSATFTVSSTVPTRSGYTFLGWNLQSTSTASMYDAGETISVGSSVTLYAVWSGTHTIYYNGNGGSGSPPTQSVTDSNSTLSMVLSSTIPVKSGYTFLGWSTSVSATTADHSAGDTISVGLSAVYLFAVWTADSTEDYSAHYYISYAISAVNNTYFKCSDMIYTLSTDTSYYVVSYVFNGSYDSGLSIVIDTSDTPYIKYCLAGSISVNGTYTCQVDILDSSNIMRSYLFTITVSDSGGSGDTYDSYTLTCDGNGGSSTVLTGTAIFTDEHYTFDLSEVVSIRSGYTFLGWSTSSSSVSPNISGSYTIDWSGTTGNVATIYAVWSTIYVPDGYLYYAVSFDSQGGSVVGTFSAYEVNTVLSHTFNISAYSSTLSGYTFIGWSMASNGTADSVITSVTVVNDGTSTYSTMIVYAVWEKSSLVVDPFTWLTDLIDSIVSFLGKLTMIQWVLVLAGLCIIVYIVRFVIFGNGRSGR